MLQLRPSLRFATIIAQRQSNQIIHHPSLQRPATSRLVSTVQQVEDWEMERNESIIRAIEKDEDVHNTMAYAFAFSDENTTLPPFTKYPNARMQEQLRNTTLLHKQAPKTMTDDEPLPRTVEAAFRPCSRAIVITETKKPFRVVNVNAAWESLCEYSYVESKGKSLGSLIRGPETDPLAVTALMSQLLRGEEAGTVITNYTKSGRKFRNRLRVGPVFEDDGKLAYFVGVLQEMKM